MKAHELIAARENWHDNSTFVAEDAEGRPCWWSDSQAVRFNLQSAVHRVYGHDLDKIYGVYCTIYGSPEVGGDKLKSLWALNRELGWPKTYEFLKRLDI